MSPRFRLDKQDTRKWLKNSAIFFAPMALLLLLALQQDASPNEMLWIVRLWMLNTAVDLTRKFIKDN